MNVTTAKKSRDAHLGQLTKLYKELEIQMLSPENTIRVRELFGRLCDKYEEFKTAYFQYFVLCEDPETKVALQKSFESCKTNFVELKERYSQWTPVEVDSISNAASSTSRLRNAIVKRLIEEQKLKTLKEHQSL
ncbi:hypothetical protein DPMN_151329 [Dreissena polymorpha]|uniref:Uncharacterized protein n=1 Tax=Dreissena polymorpha TaxID=45954 RepID=A0A9D4FI80_DREPO|nr:hypothetical protein DPMN_151329 [Dreissena polymorpha]